jgi:hypothetical protein
VAGWCNRQEGKEPKDKHQKARLKCIDARVAAYLGKVGLMWQTLTSCAAMGDGSQGLPRWQSSLKKRGSKGKTKVIHHLNYTPNLGGYQGVVYQKLIQARCCQITYASRRDVRCYSV